MALRHEFPVCGPMDLQLTEEPNKIVPKMKKPYEIDFRRGADLKNVCSQIMGRQRVKISAAAGAGKSTLLPIALANYSKLPVFHVVPSKHLNAQLFEFISVEDKSCVKVQSKTLTDAFAASGVTYTTMANMVAYLLYRKIKGSFSEFENGIYLYMDECHESDAFTNVLRSLAMEIPNVSCVIEASASHGLDNRKMAELPSQVVSERYPNISPSMWDPADQDMPWSASNLSDNALIFIDDPTSAERLISMYAYAGITAYRLHAKMSVESFLRVDAALKNPNSGVVVAIADYTFRSGFTFPVSVIIDSGVVRYVTIEGGRQAVKYRYAYQLEMYQAQHRGARVPGMDCKYYAPEKDAVNAICDLEGVETEAAALIFRYLGYIPPMMCENALMCKGDVPKSFEDVVNGSVAFPLLNESQMMPLVREAGEKHEITADVQDVLDSYGIESPITPVKDFFSTYQGVRQVLPDVVTDAMPSLLNLQTIASGGSGLVPGRYYKVAGLPNEHVESELYGGDWKTALSELQKKPHLMAGFSESERLEVVALLLSTYNTQVAVHAGINRMLEKSDTLEQLTIRYPDHAKAWLATVMAKYRESKSLQAAILTVLGDLRPPGMEFFSILPILDMEERIAKSFAARLVDAVQGIDEVVQGDDYLRYIESRIEDLPPAAGLSYDKLSIDEGRRSHDVQVYCKPVRFGSKSMWDMTFTIAGGLMWDIDKCINVADSYIRNAGMAMTSIRNLQFVGPTVDSAEILARLRKVGDLRHRHKLRQNFTVEIGNTKKPKMLLAK